MTFELAVRLVIPAFTINVSRFAGYFFKSAKIALTVSGSTSRAGLVPNFAGTGGTIVAQRRFQIILQCMMAVYAAQFADVVARRIIF